MITVQSLTFFKHLSVTCFLSFPQLWGSSQQPKLWYYFVFMVNIETGLLQPKISSNTSNFASSNALIQRCSLKPVSHLFKKNCVICLIESPLKIMKNAFHFILKALSLLKIFKLLSQLFGHVGKTTWLEKKGNFKIYDVTTWFTNNCNTHIAQYLTK